MNQWAVVVLAAGQGARMSSRLPKVLHSVCGREMLRYVVDASRTTLDSPVVVVVGPDADQIRDSLGDTVEYVEQAEPKGTGRALLEAEALLDGRASHLLVLYGDTPLVTPATLARLVERHQTANTTVTFVTSDGVPTEGLGRVERDAEGRVVQVVEEAQASEEQRSIAEVNGGLYAFETTWLWAALREITPASNGEYYLTDLVGMAVRAGMAVGTVAPDEPIEILGVDNQVRLAQAEGAMRRRILDSLMLTGVRVVDPATTYVDATVSVGPDTTIYQNTTLAGQTRIGSRCHLGPGAMVYDSVIQDDCKVVASMLEGAYLEASVAVGPYSHLRHDTYVERDVYIGNYAEVKNSRIGRGTQMSHFSYIGDAEVGQGVNIGAGVITCNFDGEQKHRTIVEDGAFIGSDTMLVAPVRIGARARTGAGSVVNRDVPPDTVVVGVPARVLHRRDESKGTSDDPKSSS
ncbi:MAG: bifunctional UDP-N-acetylglucosamine diphosphorylase/glucosamine-1-phosphate N-acetyltransferase GlmU [Chloroflexi bacterium]|nr:bifunctional UDP-N-acetylglucosamine diphosphorylase/glucosamine-1-phosphate N-acetyltransferase GlmU [Chloroflexota bacterium]